MVFPTMRHNQKTVVITIDGPAGAGKSSVAKDLAARLNFFHLDTGAMYRALTLKAIRQNCNLEDEDQLAALASATQMSLKPSEAGLKVFIDGEDVSLAIRSLEVTNNTFYIARAPKVREILVDLQREIGRQQNIVVEGRDVGTVVFPEAQIKFYLDADFEERANRRIKELREQGKDVDEAKLKQEVRERDHKDFSRKVGPLRKAENAVVIDSSGLTVEQTVDKMQPFVNKVLNNL